MSILKRLIDIIASCAGLIILSPLLLSMAVIIRLSLGSPVLFKQTRPGLYGKTFRMCKFRTMTETKDDQGRLLPDEKRLTPLGVFLRKTSLDELPELINVVKGEMSIVGPRPLLVQYLDRYTPVQARRHEMRPGITGWAQINGRNAISWEEKFALDVWYIDNWSLRLDFLIIFRTIGLVFKRHDINAEGSATMPEFMGSTNVEAGEVLIDEAAASRELDKKVR